MSGQDPSGVDSQKLEALARQLGDLERQAAELNAAIQRSGAVRKFLTLVVVVLLAFFGVLFYRTGSSFLGKENRDELKLQLQLSATANSDTLMKELRILQEHSWPPLSKAFSDQIKQDMPAIMNKMGAERETLAINLQSKLDSHVKGRYKQALAKHRTILEGEFPDIKDEEAFALMIDNFEKAFNPLVKTYYGDKMALQFTEIYKTWDDFPLDDTKRNREELADTLYMLLYELMKAKLAHDGTEPEKAKASSKAGGA
jgi:hypothetical protein